jgi:CubicO group peptidase (beta-lactamase class C family)
MVDPDRLGRLSRRLADEVAAGRLPGAVLALGVGERTAYLQAFGYAEHRNGVVRPMTADTLFDLASLTKVVATLPAILTLVDDGEVRLADPVSRFLPEFAEGGKAEVTLRHLLTHTSGLPAHRRYDRLGDGEAIREAVFRGPLVDAPGRHVVYSDLGFIVLAEVVRAVSGLPIDEYARARVFTPLGMTDTMYCPPPTLWPRVAATEEVPGIGVKVGVVHDENALAMDGVSGHAGLFAPIADLIRYVQMWVMAGPSVLSAAARRAAVRCWTDGLDGRRGLGWVCRQDAYDHCGDLWPPTAVGHTGFTGTSIAFDPVSRWWLILLTNDVHYGREQRTIVRLRALVHNLAAAALREE